MATTPMDIDSSNPPKATNLGSLSKPNGAPTTARVSDVISTFKPTRVSKPRSSSTNL